MQGNEKEKYYRKGYMQPVSESSGMTFGYQLLHNEYIQMHNMMTHFIYMSGVWQIVSA